MSIRNLDKLIAPQSVVAIGASERQPTFGCLPRGAPRGSRELRSRV